MGGGGEKNFLYGSLENNPSSWVEPSPPLTPIDSFLWTQNNFSHQQLLQLMKNYKSPLFNLNDFSSCSISGSTNDHRGGVSKLTTPQDQTGFKKRLLLDRVVVDWNQGGNLNSNSCVNQPILQVSLNRVKQPEKGNSTHWVKGQWTVEEDRKLVKLVNQYGYRKWAVIAEQMVGRIGKQCRERWHNHLRPNIKKDIIWTEEEERLIIEAHERVGNKWAEIAKCVPGRTENSIKNHWNATKRKQTSKRKIRRPERLKGIVPSTVLEEYIKNKYFNKGSTSNNSDSNTSFVTPNNNQQSTTCIVPVQKNSVIEMNLSLYSPDDEDDSKFYVAFQTFDEEMNFMKNLFENNDNSNEKCILRE